MCPHHLGAVLPDLFGKDPLVSDPPQYGASCCCFLSLLCGFCCGGLGRKQRELSWDTSMGHTVLDCVVPWIKQKGATKLAAAGFCFGSYGAMQCSKYPELFSCGASFHPSTESFCKSTGEDDLALCSAVKVPQVSGLAIHQPCNDSWPLPPATCAQIRPLQTHTRAGGCSHWPSTASLLPITTPPRVRSLVHVLPDLRLPHYSVMDFRGF